MKKSRYMLNFKNIIKGLWLLFNCEAFPQPADACPALRLLYQDAELEMGTTGAGRTHGSTVRSTGSRSRCRISRGRMPAWCLPSCCSGLPGPHHVAAGIFSEGSLPPSWHSCQSLAPVPVQISYLNAHQRGAGDSFPDIFRIWQRTNRF